MVAYHLICIPMVSTFGVSEIHNESTSHMKVDHYKVKTKYVWGTHKGQKAMFATECVPVIAVISADSV